MRLRLSSQIENLSIRKGTLNARERMIINDHVRLTQKMLSNLPFPKKLKKVSSVRLENCSG
jgi:HD-GYP domain-containing protein (c-di-GMP phosphodiesterase class II)